MPLRFEPNRGQATKDVRFVGRAGGYKVGLGAQKVTFTVPTRAQKRDSFRDVVVPMSLVGSAASPAVSAFGDLPGKSNYLMSSDPRTWITDLPTFSGVRYRGVYPRTDLVFHGDSNRLEYDFNIEPGGDPRQIAWRLDSRADVQLRDGDLVIHSDGVELRFLKPVAFQEKDNKKEGVSSAYRIQRDPKGTVVRFEVGNYDRSRTLVIDPVLVYSSHVSALSDISAMTTDASGNVYLASSSGALEVVKLAADGQTLLFDSTMGTTAASAMALTLDGAGQLYIVGHANPGYPTTPTAYQPTSGAGTHAFLTVLNAAGTGLVYSTYLQGTSSENATGVALDGAGKVLMSGWTNSPDFPQTTNVPFTYYQQAFVAKFDPAQSGNASLIYAVILPSTYEGYPTAVRSDGAGNAYLSLNANGMTTTPGAYRFDAIYPDYEGTYVAKLDTNGVVQYLAYLGTGFVSDLALDSSGNAYVTGVVNYGDFPATTGAYQTSYPNAFMSKLNAAGSALVYSTFLGGPSGGLTPTSIALPPGCTSNCTPYVSGVTNATDFPTVNAIQSELSGDSDVFITQLSADGSSALFSTYFGGTGKEDYFDLLYYYNSYYYYYPSRVPQATVDAAGNIYIAGDSYSADFPFTTPGSGNAYVAKIAPADGAIVLPNKFSIAFGQQTLNVASAESVIKLRNFGSVAATISSINTSNAAFAQTNTCGGSIPAGGSCDVHLTFTAATPGVIAGTLTVTHSGSNSPTTVSLSGEGLDRGLLSVTPSSLQFGAQPVGSSTPLAFTITNIGSQPATIYNISRYYGTIQFQTATNCPAQLPSLASCTATVTFVPNSVGQFSDYINVSSAANVVGGGFFPIYGTGTLVGQAVVTPSSTAVEFTDQAVGTQSVDSYRIRFTSTGTVPVAIGPGAITGDFLITSAGCNGGWYLPGNYCEMYVAFKPTATGARTGTLTIPNTAGPDVQVSLTGLGIADVSSLVFSPTALVFPDQVIGTTSTYATIQVRNNGNQPVDITRVFDSGGDFRITYNGCGLVGQYNTCTVNVAFTPTTVGTRNGSVTFIDTATGSPHTVSVTGNGVSSTATVTPSPTVATFDDTVVGTNGPTYSFYLFNSGNAPVTASAPQSSGADFVVTYNGCDYIYANSYCQINVQFRPQAAGQRTGTITIPHSVASSPAVINVSGLGLTASQTLTASSLSSGFPDTIVGQTSSPQLIYFYNTGNADVHVSSVAVSGDFGTYSDGCTNATITPGSYCYYYVQFSPIAAGTRSGTLTLFDNAPGSPHTVSLSGNGVNAVTTLVPTPTSLGFDDQVVGTSSSRTLTLYNPGNVSVTVSNIAVSGDFATSGCSTIAKNSSCSLSVTFTPTAVGLRTGTITLTDTASGSPHGISVYGVGLSSAKTIAVSPASLDFGNAVTAVSAPAQKAYITNTGDTSVSISSVVASSPFTVSGCVTTLSPGASCTMTVGLNPSTTGVVNGTITITDAASGSPHTVSLTANGVSSAPVTEVRPNGASFVPTVVGLNAASTESVAFFNRTGSSIIVSSVVPTGDFAVNTNGCTTVTNGASCTVTIKFTPTATGNRTGTLTFTHNGPGGSSAVNLYGYGRPSTSSVQISATAIAFADQVVGTSGSIQTVTLWNNGTIPVTYGATTISPSDFVITGNGCTATVAPGSSCSVSMKFQPNSAGTITGSLTVNANDPGSPHVVTLTGVGVTASKQIALSSSSMQFRDQAVGYVSAQQSFTVYNTGNATVNFTAPSVTGDFAIPFNGCPATLSVGSNCSFNISFTPTATGARAGTFTLNDDAAGAPHNLALSGNGVTATKTYVLSASSMAFSDLPVGTQGNSQYVTLHNSGTAPIVISGTTVTGDFLNVYNGCGAQTITPQNSCTLYVAFKPTTTGVRTGTVTIGTDAAAGAAVISLTGNGVNPDHSARLSATALSFSDQSVGSTSNYQYVYVYNTGNVPLNISSVVFSGDFSNPYGNYCVGTVSVGSYCVFYAVFTPTAAGARTGTVTITDDSTTSPHVVSLSGNGLTPSLKINLNPVNLIFPATVVGSTSDYIQVTVTNVGNAPVQMNSTSITGADFKVYSSSCESTTLSVGGYHCYVYVQFKPTATGALTGTLNFNTNVSGSPQTLALSGTGTDPSTTLVLSQNSITFANQPTNTTSPAAYVYLVNQGSSPVTVSSVVAAGDYQASGCINTTIYQSSIYYQNSCAVTVTFKPTATGLRTGTVTITDNATGSPRVISLSGTGVTPFPIVTLVPNNLTFGNQGVAVPSATQTVTVYNTGSAPLNVTSVGSVTSDFTVGSGCAGTTVAVGSNCQFTVRSVPTTTGPLAGSVQIVDDASGSPHSVALTANGVIAGPVAQLSTNSVVFGSQLVNTTSAAQTINVNNTGTTTLSVGAPSISGPFAVSANTCASVAPAGLCTISVTFTPTAAGLTSGTLSISDNAPGSPHVVGLSGTGLSGPALTINPGNLVFNSQQLTTTSAAQTVTLSNSGSTVTISSVTITPGPFTQTNSCTTIGTGGSCNISVSFAPTSVGTQTGTMTITDDAPGSPHTVALSGNGVGQPAVTLSPPSLDFGNQNVGTTSGTQTVSLSNTGAGPLAIASIAATGDYLVTHNCGNNLSAGASCTLTVSFHPSGANTRAGTVQITDNASGSPHSVSLTGVGIGAVASLVTTPLNFGSQTVGTSSAAQTIALTNTGNVTLNISSIVSTSPQFPQTNDCGNSLAASAGCTISVTFAPTVTGALGGYITVTTDVSTQNVALNGSGIGPFATLSPAGTLNFGNVALGTPSPAQVLTVNSTGTTALTISSVSISGGSGDFSQTNNCPATLAVGSNCKVNVTFTPAGSGSRNGTLFIGDNGQVGGHSVSLAGTGLGPLITLNPSSLNFGTVGLNTTTSPQQIVVTNSGTVTITGLAISAATGDFAQSNNCPATLAVNATCNINVTFTPTVAGSRSGSLSVTSNASTQTASFSGAGSGPLLQLNPTSLAFGNIVINTTSTARTVTLSNGGNATLNLSSIAAGGDFSQTNNCPGSLTVGSFCTISVSFTPTSLGAQTGGVTIVDDAGGSPHVIGLSGTGIVPQEDLVLAGVANPASIPPGGNTTYTFTITNNGPSVATSVNFTASLPTNALVTSATASTGSCTTAASITCTLADMPVNSTATVTIAATATVNGSLSTTASISAAEPDPVSTNNQVTVTAIVAVADLSLTSQAQAGNSPTYMISVVNNGPAPASNVMLSCTFDRFGSTGVTTSQGSCSRSGSVVSCVLGALGVTSGNVSPANVLLQVQPPSQGWATIACKATATEFDPTPVNNLAQITPEGATNTVEGDNVGVQLYDGRSGAAARVVFPSVKVAGTTALVGVAGATPPAGFRNGSAAWTYDVTTTASTVGSPVVSFAFAPTQFRHPANVRLFHMENGAWVDRTIANDPATNSVAAIAGSLSPFALFEPVNHAPVANAGSDRVVAGTSVLGATITLDGNASDVDGDALSYRWSGPFTEGNGVVAGTKPNVTLPFGTSKLTLVTNDGETDSQPVTINVTVTDFGVTAVNATASLARGQSTTIPITVDARGGAFDQFVALGCGNLPAGVTCQFSPATVKPGANGASSTLTISATTTAANHRQPAPWTFGTLMFGAAGVVLMGGKRKRHVVLLTLALLALLLLLQVGCGGGGGTTTSSNKTTTTNPATTVTITVTGTSAGLQHSSTVNVTLN